MDRIKLLKNNKYMLKLNVTILQMHRKFQPEIRFVGNKKLNLESPICKLAKTLTFINRFFSDIGSLLTI